MRFNFAAASVLVGRQERPHQSGAAPPCTVEALNA